MFMAEEGRSKAEVLDNTGWSQGGMWELWFILPSHCRMRMIKRCHGRGSFKDNTVTYDHVICFIIIQIIIVLIHTPICRLVSGG